VRVNVWVAAADTPFVALTTILYTPPVVAPGVPESLPVDLDKVTPEGSDPLSEYVGAGLPVAVVRDLRNPRSVITETRDRRSAETATGDQANVALS
jgi:hypothetical protein